MADEFVKYLGIDISKSLTELNRLEKAFADTMGRIDKAYDDMNKKTASDKSSISARLGARYRETDYKRLFDEIQEVENAQKKSEKLAHDYRLAMYKDLFDEQERLEKEAQAEKKKRDKEALKEETRLAREAQKEKARIEKEAQKNRLKEEEQYWNEVKNNADAALDVYTNVMRKVVNVIQKAFKDAISYVEEYDKALTSISLVTMKPGGKDVIGETYENLAKEMSVTATELATAGEELYRQGLGDDEVLGRMEAITTYAKISGETFSDSVEMITAAVNSFAKEGEDTTDLTMHIVDVWAKLGDAVATSASEIGVAMQKVAASGQAAGFTMEELSASIAVIESQTRAAAESVGTALNSMMSRYMKVSSAGWNTFVTTDEGDVVKINDIAKALESVGLSIVDAKGEFLDFSEILIQLSGVWTGLSDANKNYIATQMAGTRSLNYFLSLMNNYDEVLELTAQGYDSAGVALEKYGIWTEGVEASQNRLTATMQDFYSNVLDSDTVVKFIDGISSLVEFFDRATESSGKANIGIGLFVTALMMGVSVLGKFRSLGGTFSASLGAIARGFVTSTSAINGTAAAATGATVAVSGLKAAMMSIGIGLLVGVITSVISGLVSMNEEVETSTERIQRLAQEMDEIGSSLETTQNKMNSVEELTKRLEALGQKTTYTADEIREFNSIRDQLITTAPEIAELYGIESQAVNDLGSEYERTIGYARQLHTELAVQNWKTAADGMKSAMESLQMVDASRYANDDENVSGYYDIGFNLSDGAKKHEISNVSKKAYDAYMAEGYTNVHELQQLVDEHSELLTQYDAIIEKKWADVFGKDVEIDVEAGYSGALAKINEQIAILEEEMKATGDTTLKDQISELYDYQEEIREYFEIRSELTARQSQYTKALADSQAELSAKEQEAWDIIVRGSSRAEEVIAGYGYDTYQALLDALMGFDFAGAGVKNDQLGRTVTSWFDNINDEIANAVNTNTEEINRIVNEEIPEGGITKDIVERMIAADAEIEKQIYKWTGETIDTVHTAADPIITQWRDTLQTMYENLAVAVTDPMQMDIFKTQLEHSDFSQQVYAMIAQAMTDESIDVVDLLNTVLTMSNDEAFEYLMGVTVVPEITIDSDASSAKLSEQIEGFIKSYETYSGINELSNKLELGVQLNADDLKMLAEAAESLGFEDVDLSTAEGVADAVERVAAALLAINGDSWGTFGVGVESDSANYKKATGKRDNMQTLTDGIAGIATEGLGYDVSAMVEAYPQLIQYLGDLNTFRDEAILLLQAEKEENAELLNQYGLTIDETENLAEVLDAYARGTNKAEAASKKLSKGLDLTADECKSLIDDYPELAESLIDYADGAITAEEMIERLNRAAASTNMSNMTEGLASALAEYDAAAENSTEATAALERMGFLLSGGMGDMSSLDFAVQNLDLIRSAINGDIEAFQRLAEASVINIVGSANVDFSAAENGLITVYNASADAINELNKLGMFDIDTITTTNRVQTSVDLATGNPIYEEFTNTYHMLKLKGKNNTEQKKTGSGGSSGRSGGGGGGSSSSSSSSSAGVSERVQKMVDEMNEEIANKDYRLDIAIAWEDYYNTTGELKKAIPFMEEQLAIYKEMTGVYEENSDELQALANSKQTEINNVKSQIAQYTKLRDQYSKNSKNYKKYNKTVQELREKEEGLQADYELLTDTLDEYRLQNIETQKQIEQTTQAIEDQKREIRKLVITMQEKLQGFYEEIEDAEKSRLDATISMQDLILERLKERAQAEIDLDKEVLENKKAALEEEISAIRENFEEARALAEGNANEDELTRLQGELAAVITDPSRARERAELEKQIAELQSDMAWDAAEEQIAAQEEATQSKIDEIDREIEKLEEAYDSIEDYSEAMIEEMYSIMEKTDKEIIDWLKLNSDEYANSTEEARQQLVDDWTETMNTIKSITETNWDDINNILNKGAVDEALALLKKTDAYKSASKEQKQEMEDDLKDAWKGMVNGQKELENKPVVSATAPKADVTKAVAAEAATQGITATTKGRFNLRKGYSTSSDSILVMPKGASVEIDGYHGNWYHGTYNGKEGWVHNTAFAKQLDLKKLKKYANGGLVDYTGLAWVDGTPGRPEMMLDPSDTDAFRRFVMLLEKWNMPMTDSKESAGGLTIEGDIVVQVGGINNDDDYENVGQKVMDAIYDKFKIRR